MEPVQCTLYSLQSVTNGQCCQLGQRGLGRVEIRIRPTKKKLAIFLIKGFQNGAAPKLYAEYKSHFLSRILKDMPTLF